MSPCLWSSKPCKTNQKTGTLRSSSLLKRVPRGSFMWVRGFLNQFTKLDI